VQCGVVYMQCEVVVYMLSYRGSIARKLNSN
jgi:hypothetical protein